MMARALRPRQPLAVTPLYVSQYTAPTIVGVKTERAFLDFVAKHKVPHVREGKTVLVDVDDLRAVLSKLATVDEAGPHTAERDDGEQPSTADDVLRTIGLRRAS